MQHLDYNHVLIPAMQKEDRKTTGSPPFLLANKQFEVPISLNIRFLFALKIFHEH